jgi:hypothetical protein
MIYVIQLWPEKLLKMSSDLFLIVILSLTISPVFLYIEPSAVKAFFTEFKLSKCLFCAIFYKIALHYKQLVIHTFSLLTTTYFICYFSRALILFYSYFGRFIFVTKIGWMSQQLFALKFHVSNLSTEQRRSCFSWLAPHTQSRQRP